ncbi:hypothetical protein [Sphingobacterium prati]|nr:hypothetical protein [Sphingobacterium prati]NPE47847.1 hypothetical protein [Sphingobacterium prati]
MKKNSVYRFSKANRTLIVLSNVNGELFLEETMEKYNIIEKRTIVI